MNMKMMGAMMDLMSHEKRDGFILGLLIASYICEERSGARASHDAMAIMKYRASVILSGETGQDVPHWPVRNQTLAVLRPEKSSFVSRISAPQQSRLLRIVATMKRYPIGLFVRNWIWGVQSYPYIRLGSQRCDQVQAVLNPAVADERVKHRQDHRNFERAARVILIPQTT